MFYDPMIAKLITWAPTREAAIDAQVEALDAFQIDGHRPQCRFPLGADAAPALPRRATLTTGFIAEEYPEGFHGAPADEQLLDDLAAIAALVELTHDDARRR